VGTVQRGAGRQARGWRWLLLLGGGLGIGIAAAWAAEPGGTAGAETRAVMDPIFGALRTVLPYSLSPERFRDPANRDTIAAGLATLGARAGDLARHGRTREASFAFLSGSLANDARELQKTFDEGRSEEARFRFRELIDTCVACHSRLPSDTSFPLGERLVKSLDAQGLPLEERARLEVATRQFDAALASYEALFASPDALPVDFDIMGELDDYLEISIRVKNDLERPIRTLETLSQREDTPQGLREDLRSWVLSLRQISKRDFSKASLAEARHQVSEAESFDPIDGDRRALIHYLAASSLLHRLIAEPRFAAAAAGKGGPETAELAEAYVLLGTIEARVGRALWPWQAESLLETAIRLQPRTPLAQRAYALLDEFVTAGYSGTGGTQIPEDERAKLEELRVLSGAPPGSTTPHDGEGMP
jgi:hypothetical protein